MRRALATGPPSSHASTASAAPCTCRYPRYHDALRGPAEALVIDAWSEAPRASTVATGVAFPFQAPRAQPPQTVLIAVPPPSTPWSLALVEAIIDETIIRAKGRMISPTDVRNQLAPTLLVADDPAELVPSIDLQVVSAVVEVEAHV